MQVNGLFTDKKHTLQEKKNEKNNHKKTSKIKK